MACLFGSERRPEYQGTAFIFINAPSWVCAAFPEGGALSNICEFWTAIASFLVQTPIELAIAWFGAYATAEGAILLEPFCAIAPPEVEEIFPLDVAGALLSLVIPFSDQILAAELNRKIGLKVQSDRWALYCKCKLPEPDPPLPDPDDPPDPNPDPPIPSPPCPGSTFTIIGTQYWTNSVSGLILREICLTLPTDQGWVYQFVPNAEVPGWVVYNSTYAIIDFPFASNVLQLLPKEAYSAEVYSDGSFSEQFDESLTPEQIAIIGSAGFADNGGLEQPIPLFGNIENSGNQIRAIRWQSINVSCTYNCSDIQFTPNPAPEPPLDACDLDEALCKPKHGCRVKAFALEYSNDCGEPAAHQWQYNYGVCEEESVNVNRSLNCASEPDEVTLILKKAPVDNGGGLN